MVPLLPPLGFGTVVVPAGTAAEIHFFSLPSPLFALNTASTCRNRRHVKRHGRGQSSRTSSRTKQRVTRTKQKNNLTGDKYTILDATQHACQPERVLHREPPSTNFFFESDHLSPPGEYKRTQNRRFGHDSCSGGRAS